MQKRAFRWLHLALFTAACLFVTGVASVQADNNVKAQIRDFKMSKAGDTVELTGSKDVKGAFCPGSVVSMYRMSAHGPASVYHSRWEVGKVQILRNVNDRQVEAKVIEGDIRAGDLALQTAGSCELKKNVSMLFR